MLNYARQTTNQFVSEYNAPSITYGFIIFSFVRYLAYYLAERLAPTLKNLIRERYP